MNRTLRANYGSVAVDDRLPRVPNIIQSRSNLCGSGLGPRVKDSLGQRQWLQAQESPQCGRECTVAARHPVERSNGQQELPEHCCQERDKSLKQHHWGTDVWYSQRRPDRAGLPESLISHRFHSRTIFDRSALFPSDVSFNQVDDINRPPATFVRQCAGGPAPRGVASKVSHTLSF